VLVYRKTAYTGQSDYSVVVVVVSWRERERETWAKELHAQCTCTCTQYIRHSVHILLLYLRRVHSSGSWWQRRRNDCRLSSVCHVRRRRPRGPYSVQHYIIIPRHQDDGRILLNYYLTGMSRDRHPSGIWIGERE